MIGACTIGKRRLGDVLERYGVERFRAHMDYVIDASERQVRAEVERWADGTYDGESWMVSDGLDPYKRYRIAVGVTIAGSEITFDFSETDDQAPGFTNMPAASAVGAISDRVPDAAGRRRPDAFPPTTACSPRCTPSSGRAR